MITTASSICGDYYHRHLLSFHAINLKRPHHQNRPSLVVTTPSRKVRKVIDCALTHRRQFCHTALTRWFTCPIFCNCHIINSTSYCHASIAMSASISASTSTPHQHKPPHHLDTLNFIHIR
uniref:Uncharacterized protein n=1 Tax=Davidia involucrata TaxID=16924 RepID=A0A5B6YSA4_DAVIN